MLAESFQQQRVCAMNDDTIAAISTPPGEGGIGIVRLSGPQSFAIARKIIFFPREIKEPESHRLYYGYVVDKRQQLHR